MLAWVRDPGDRGRMLHEINKNIYKKLGQAGIEIPFPQRVLHLASDEQKHSPEPADLRDESGPDQ